MKFRQTLSSVLLSYRGQIRLFLIPYILGSLILIVLPALATTAVAFTEYNTMSTPTWNGLENFRSLIESPVVRISVRSSLIFLLTAVPLRLLAALLLALLLQQKRRFFGLHRAVVYLPTIIPEVAYALIWLWIFNPLYGPLNIILTWLGLPAPAWLVEPDTAVAAIIIMSLFQIGEGFVVLMAGLQTIPRSYYEAAKVDGASSLQSFWRITLPLILPWLLILSFRDLLVSLQNTFTPSFVMTYGGPYYATSFIPLLVYELAFDLFDFGMAAALLIIMYLLILLLVFGILNLIGGVHLSDDL